jgi:multiple sugar transport system substrate-binding protein
MKKFLTLALAAILILVTLSSCKTAQTDNGKPGASDSAASTETSSQDSPQASADKPDGPIEITFMPTQSLSSLGYMGELVEKFNASQDAIVVKEITGEGGYIQQMEKYQTLAAVGEQPDVSIVGLSYTGYMIDNMPVVPIQEFIDAEQFDTSDFYPTMLDLGRGGDGQVWMLPFGISTPVIYYSKSLFTQAGLDPENPPDTFEEVRTAAQKIAALGDGIQGFNSLGIFDTEAWAYQALVESMGGRLLSEDGTGIAFNNEIGLKALKFITDMTLVDKSMVYQDTTQSVQLFLGGKLGMYVFSSAWVPSIAENPDIGVMPFPSDGVHPKRVAAGGNCISISASTPEKEAAAWEFVKFMTSPEGVTAVAKNSYMATRMSVVEKDEYLGSYLKEEPRAGVSYEQIAEMVPWQNFPGESARISQIITDKMQAAVSGQMSPEEALAEIEAEANKLLK